jgi:uncharacterized protein YgiM (DUF1202 family)
MLFRRLLLFTVCLALLAVPVVRSADAGSMSVQVRQSPVRTAPSFMARIVATLNYGDRVDIVSSRGTWSRVFVPGGAVTGWVHTSALTKKKIILKAGASDVGKNATSDELALAGKGFNKKVEGEFRTKNRNLDYTWVDRMEKIKVSNSGIRKFLKEGAVSPKGGVQ